MKNTIRTNLAALAVAGLALTARAETSPGYVEFGKLTPPGKGAEFVEVQIRSNLLGLAAGIVAKENPEAAKVIRSVELIQVNVVGITKENRAELDQRLAKVRADLDAKNWERNVSVQGKKGEDVAVFTKTRGAEALAGIAITVKDEKNVVFVNIVGDIKPEQVAALGESLNIEPLKEAGAAFKKDKTTDKAEK
jgi:hypothetical protein